MAYYDVISFASTLLTSATIKQVEMFETEQAITRMVALENGAIFDADGTVNADLSLGKVYVRYQIIPDSPGMGALNTLVAVLKSIDGKHGQMTGKQYGTSTVTVTCNARCESVVQEPYTISQPPMTANATQRTFVNVVWQKKTEWV